MPTSLGLGAVTELIHGTVLRTVPGTWEVLPVSAILRLLHPELCLYSSLHPQCVVWDWAGAGCEEDELKW